eukprot:727960-Alexandrium_andersonii.AAC.1
MMTMGHGPSLSNKCARSNNLPTSVLLMFLHVALADMCLLFLLLWLPLEVLTQGGCGIWMQHAACGTRQ